MGLDATDTRILAVLMGNARLSYRQLGKHLKLSAATVMTRVKQLEQGGVIKGYAARLDYDKLSYDVMVLIEMRISRGKLLEVEKKIAAHPNVVAIYDHTGAFDALVVARFKSRKSMDQFLKKLQTYDFVERTETSLVLNTTKEILLTPV